MSLRDTHSRVVWGAGKFPDEVESNCESQLAHLRRHLKSNAAALQLSMMNISAAELLSENSGD